MLGLIGGAIAFYLFGGIPFAFIGTYLSKKERIDELGSKNVGVANTFSSAGPAAGIVAVVGEISKALVPIIVAYLVFNPNLATKTFIGFISGNYNRHIAFLFVSMSFLGTNFSPFLRFRGGMGFTITLWSLLLLAPAALVILGGSLIILTFAFKSYAKASSSTEKGKYLFPVLCLISTFWTEFWWSAFLYGSIISATYYIKRNQNLEEIRLTERAFHPSTKMLKDFYKTNCQYVYFLEELGRMDNIGNKAYNISFLNRMRFKVPETMVITYDAFNAFLQGDQKLLEHLRRELAGYMRENSSYSVRSSANYEDEREYSFAGQFQTYLNVNSLDEVIQAISNIWESSLEAAPVYRSHVATNIEDLEMGILIQEMIQPKYSGVVFTRDPVYNLNEIIIEVVHDLGQSLVQDGVTPERWVYKWNQWLKIPDEDKVEILNQIVKEAKQIEQYYGEPVDLEFVYDGNEVYWLQLRAITTVKRARLYSNKISRDMLPGMIKPLIFSVNIPVVNTSWKKIFRQMIGSPVKRIKIQDLTKSFYYRAYFNMGVIGDIFQVLGMPRDLLEILAGIDIEGVEKPKFKPTMITLRFLPRMVVFMLRLFLISKQIEKHLRKYREKYKDMEIQATQTSELDMPTLISQIDKLFKLNIQSSYFVILSQLLNSLYTSMVRRWIEDAGYSFEKMDFALLNPRIKHQDFRRSLEKLHKYYLRLPESDRDRIKMLTYEEIKSNKKFAGLSARISHFLQRFGFLRENGNDFSIPAWSEIPDTVLKMLIDFEPPKNKDYSLEETRTIIAEVCKNPISRMFYNRSVKYQEYREIVNELYMYGYGLFRPFFLQIGRNLVEQNILNEMNDIFYLKYEEIKKILADQNHKLNPQEVVRTRKAEMEKYRDIDLPEIIYDDNPPEPIKIENSAKELNGVATSRGICKGRVRVARSIDDYGKIQDGDIIVIPYSDVSWTPLFAKAKGVISESGGILSHCSIVAREYKIPAVVSVNGALSLKDNTLVALDGNTGKISIIQEAITEDAHG